MLVAGAKRHAKEVLQILEFNNEATKITFFDDVSKNINGVFLERYEVLTHLTSAKDYFENIDHRFILALGTPLYRKLVAEKLTQVGGKLTTIVANSALIGNHQVELGIGLNIMHQVMISNSVKIGRGSLINAFSSIHHDTIIGDFCEVSPHAVLLGGSSLGNFTSVGANATVLPNVSIGSNVIVGAGSVVTKDIPDNCLVVGVPAIVKKELKKIE
ncbi:MAG: acetyltransferase [Chitinophagaceae bacterium]|nr:acetyltransferase [Chitinophagaceae bacterium]